MWGDDEGEAEEEEEADEDQDVGREEGAPQVSVLGDIFWAHTKWCTESKCKCYKQDRIAVISFVPPCNIKGNDAVGNDKDDDWDDGVVLHEGGNQRKAHHSHKCVREDENHALQCLNNIAFNFKYICELVLCHPFGQ